MRVCPSGFDLIRVKFKREHRVYPAEQQQTETHDAAAGPEVYGGVRFGRETGEEQGVQAEVRAFGLRQAPGKSSVPFSGREGAFCRVHGVRHNGLLAIFRV